LDALRTESFEISRLFVRSAFDVVSVRSALGAMTS